MNSDSSIPDPDDVQFSSGLPAASTGTVSAPCSDELAVLKDLSTAKGGGNTVIAHRTWQTRDIFRSEPREAGTSSPIEMVYMASSPPPTPSRQKKRKFADLDLGVNQLARPIKAQRTYYGIDVHELLEEAQKEEGLPKAPVDLPTPPAEQHASKRSSLLWTEKYRARKFTDLIGDERTHRSVMHWLKRWDTIVFPGSHRPKTKPKNKGFGENAMSVEERPHRKILLLTGAPGLGKTTLAHVCARQAGYEVQEINASDERSSGVVKGRIRDMVGTENVKGVDTKTIDGKVRKAGKPVCVVVDEVDGVVSGSGGGGEGGFVKALIDLVTLDQKNSSPLGTMQQAPTRKKKGDRFRLLRPLILICNDVYHPSLRPLRQSTIAEIVHMRKPAIQTITTRMHAIFEKESVPCESDGVRRLCEAAWGVSNRKEDRGGSGAGEGDMRGIMVVGEWVARKLRALNDTGGNAKLTRRWVEDNLLRDLAHGGGATRGLGRGGPKDIVDRVFQEGAGFPKSSATVTPRPQQTGGPGVQGVAEGQKRTATERLRELVDTLGDTDRIMTDCFSSYASQTFQDDTFLSKPDAAYEWLHFHDALSSAVFQSNEWELAPYLSTPVLAFHHLFASPTRAQYSAPAISEQNGTVDTDGMTPIHPFAGPQASWAAHEATKHNDALLQILQNSLSDPLARSFTSIANLSTELLPYLLRMVSPNINPVVIKPSSTSTSAPSGAGTASVRKASEQSLVTRSVRAMHAAGIRFERTRVTDDDSSSSNTVSWKTNQQWIYRMEPSIDTLGTFETGGKGFGEEGGKQRFAVRQVLEQEWQREEARRAEVARKARFAAGGVEGEVVAGDGDVEAVEHEKVKDLTPAVKRDFFGRAIVAPVVSVGSEEFGSAKGAGGGKKEDLGGGKVWVTFHEGFSNAVRKPITLAELIKGM